MSQLSESFVIGVISLAAAGFAALLALLSFALLVYLLGRFGLILGDIGLLIMFYGPIPVAAYVFYWCYRKLNNP